MSFYVQENLCFLGFFFENSLKDCFQIVSSAADKINENLIGLNVGHMENVDEHPALPTLLFRGFVWQGFSLLCRATEHHVSQFVKTENFRNDARSENFRLQEEVAGNKGLQ